MAAWSMTREFARRTRKNLEFIERHRHLPGSEVYEAAGQIHALAGILAFFPAWIADRLPAAPFAALEAAGWPALRTGPTFPRCAGPRELLRCLRTALRQLQFQPLHDDRGEITGLRLRNRQGGRQTWETELSLPELRSLTAYLLWILERDDWPAAASPSPEAEAAQLPLL